MVRWLAWSLLAGILLLGGLNVWMILRSQARITADPSAVPPAPVALVLGTSRTLASGRTNVFWTSRMDAAAALWKAGKVSHFLVSGDNRASNYNEPRDMRDGLVERGVPIRAITLDYAGLRTLDSVIRAREIFGVEQCVIVSDDFHLPRALWLAECRNMQVSGFHGPPATMAISGRTRVREWLARINAALEEWVLETGARHYGEKQALPSPNTRAVPERHGSMEPGKSAPPAPAPRGTAP